MDELTAGCAPAAKEVKETKKEEPKKEAPPPPPVEEEEEVDMGDLFGWSYLNLNHYLTIFKHIIQNSNNYHIDRS